MVRRERARARSRRAVGHRRAHGRARRRLPVPRRTIARGCAIHRASLEQGWDFRGVKPSICRLFPLSYGEGTIVVSDDYPDYSCAYEDDAPTLYRVARDALADVFGAELVRAMDAAEARVLARQLKVVAP